MKEGKNLVIVESPAKAGTIQKFLGNDYIVKSSFGHIRDLHDSELSIDVKGGFKPEYVIPADKKKVVSELEREKPSHGIFSRLSTLTRRTQEESYSMRSQRTPSSMR